MGGRLGTTRPGRSPLPKGLLGRLFLLFTLGSSLVFLSQGRAEAIPAFANGQGLSCTACHTTFPGMTPYGMMTMMSNFQDLDYRKQRQAFPLALRLQVETLLANKSHPASTVAQTLSILGGGFIGPHLTWYGEQPIVDSGFPGVTEQMWLSWNGLFHGSNSIQVGKFHTPFPFMPAHGWTLGNYLLATQTTGQNTFNPNDARWGTAFSGMTGNWMYNASWLAGSGPIGSALDYSPQGGPRTLDLNVTYGGMVRPWALGAVAMKGTAPLFNSSGAYAAGDSFTRQGLYYSYQTRSWFVQTMYYRGEDARPDLNVGATPFRGAMLEIERDFGWRNHVLVRYDVASSDTLNRQYIFDDAYNFLPNLKVTGELAMQPGASPSIAFAFDWAGPFQRGKRYLWNPPVGVRLVSVKSAPPSVGMTGTNMKSMPGMSMPGMSMPGMNMPANSNAQIEMGEHLVAANGCSGCHGATFGGGVGPKLYGIEHRLAPAQIADFIAHPRAPMPNFGFTKPQVAAIVAYLSSLDGGMGGMMPTLTTTPVAGQDAVVVTVRFPAMIPKSARIVTAMSMGGGAMHGSTTALHPTADPHVWTATVHFTMAGPWTLRLEYGNMHLTQSIVVGDSR